MASMAAEGEQAVRKTEVAFREFVATLMASAPEPQGLDWNAVRDAGAEDAGVSVGTAQGYLRKLTSVTGLYRAEGMDHKGIWSVRILNK